MMELLKTNEQQKQELENIKDKQQSCTKRSNAQSECKDREMKQHEEKEKYEDKI